MGACFSTILPRRRVLGTPRNDSPKESTPLSDDSDNKKGLSVEVKLDELPESVNSKYPPDEKQSELEPPPNGAPSQHLPDEEDNNRVPNGAHEHHLPDDVHEKSKDAGTKRRALLVGITYTNPWNTWSQLDGPHGDVDQYRDLLISA